MANHLISFIGADGRETAATTTSGLPVSLGDSQVTISSSDTNGSGPVLYTTNTTPVTGGNFSFISCLTETVFSSLTRTGATGSITGVTLPAGTLLVGPFTAYTLTSGAVAAYT